MTSRNITFTAAAGMQQDVQRRRATSTPCARTEEDSLADELGDLMEIPIAPFEFTSSSAEQHFRSSTRTHQHMRSRSSGPYIFDVDDDDDDLQSDDELLELEDYIAVDHDVGNRRSGGRDAEGARVPTGVCVRAVERGDGHSSTSLQRFCSWCWKTSVHSLVHSSLFTRNTYCCGACFAETVACVTCSTSMCRSFGDHAHKLCVKCDGSVRTAALPSAQSLVGVCSWCSRKATHSLYESSIVQRNTYTCKSCRKLGCICFRCKKGFTRGTEKLCVTCEPPPVKSNVWCTWCCEKSTHEMLESSLLGKNTYQCLLCRNKTLVCSYCETAMICGGLDTWDISKEECCIQCTVNEFPSWDSLRQKKLDVFDPSRYTPESVKKVHAMDSPLRSLAAQRRMLRPFLSLATMSPPARNQCANLLGTTLIVTSFFGDAHAEAWHIVRLLLTFNDSWDSLVRELLVDLSLIDQDDTSCTTDVLFFLCLGRLYARYLLEMREDPPRGARASSLMASINRCTRITDTFSLTWATSLFFPEQSQEFLGHLQVYLGPSRLLRPVIMIFHQMLRMAVAYSIHI